MPGWATGGLLHNKLKISYYFYLVKKLRQTFWAFFILLCPFGGPAQDFGSIDSFARSVDMDRMTLPQLTDSLTKACNTDLEKVRVIFVWIAHNIAYDYKKLNILQLDSLAYFRDTLFDDKVLIKNVLERRMGICYDYASLFREMCWQAGIEAKMVKGYAKTSYREIGNMSPKHAWNVVKIDGKWQLLDVTWASERRYPEQTVEEIEESYFLTPPDKLILDHWPEDEQWQLLEKKVDKQQFIDFPDVSSYYLKYEVQGFSPGYGIIPADGREIQLSIKIAELDRAVRVVEDGEVLSDLFPVYENGNYIFLYSISEETESDNISIAIQDESGNFDIVITYKLMEE